MKLLWSYKTTDEISRDENLIKHSFWSRTRNHRKFLISSHSNLKIWVSFHGPNNETMCPKASSFKTAKERDFMKIPQFHLRSPSYFFVSLNRRHRVHAHLKAWKRLTLEWILNAIIAVKINRLATDDVGKVQFLPLKLQHLNIFRRHIHKPFMKIA